MTREEDDAESRDFKFGRSGLLLTIAVALAFVILA
jgi:hypothetical protein